MSASGALAGDAAGPRSGRAAPPTDRIAAAVFAALVLASFAAFFITQRLKHTPTTVQRFELTPFFSPTPSGHHKREAISFRIRAADAVTVSIVDSAGDEVATLVRDRPLARYTQLSLLWNGHRGPGPTSSTALGTPQDPIAPRDRGTLAPEGEYRVSVSLRDAQRTVLSPKSFTLVRRRKAATSTSEAGE